MSGPKLMQVTTSPLAILINEAVFMAVGKVAYFSPKIEGVNKDIENEIEWFENYVEQVKTTIPGGGGGGGDAVNASLKRITIIKNKYTSEMRRSIVSKEVLDELEAPEINQMLVNAIRMLPVKKEAFVEEISEALKYVEVEMKKAREKELAKKRELAKIEARKREEKRAREKEAYKNNEKTYAEEIENYKETLKADLELEQNDEGWVQFDLEDMERPAIGNGDEPESEPDFPDISEQIKIEMISCDLESSIKSECLEDEEKDLLCKLTSDLDNLKTDNEFFSPSSKRVILKRLEINYNALNKMIAKRKMAEAETMKVRGSLEAEYLTYTKALEMTAEDVSRLSLEELDKKAYQLRDMMLERVRAEYMEDAITEIMQNKGYASVSTSTVSEDGISCMVFENDENMNIRASMNDDMIMIEVVGNGENEPTPEEIKQIVSNQGELCRIYPEIKAELEEKGIHIESETCAPISADTAKNIPIGNKKEKKKKRFGFGRLASSVPSGQEDVQRYLEKTISKYQYMEAGQ